MREKIDIVQATTKGANYCSRGEKCISQVKEKLYQWGAQNEDIDTIIAYLIEERYIDEERYSAAYVRDKYRFNKWGRRKISMMLLSKHIDKEIINRAIESIDPEEYYNILCRVIKEKNRTIKCGSTYECESKLFNHAYSRGYESDLITDAIKESSKD